MAAVVTTCISKAIMFVFISVLMNKKNVDPFSLLITTPGTRLRAQTTVMQGDTGLAWQKCKAEIAVYLFRSSLGFEKNSSTYKVA